MSKLSGKLNVAFLHPDLGIGGAERLVVDAALGLQRLGHTVHIYTSHHDPNHCFEETRDGTLTVRCIRPPFPRSLAGKGHILFAHLRQLHLTLHLLLSGRAATYDVYFVDQLPTCIPLLRAIAHKRVVFYGHFPDKLLADGQFVEGEAGRGRKAFMKRLYRLPMDWLEEVATRQTDILLANSKFTARIFKTYFSSIRQPARVVYPGINTEAYGHPVPQDRESIGEVFSGVLTTSDRPTLVSLNRFEKKKNVALAIKAFSTIRQQLTSQDRARGLDKLRLVLAGGFDPRLHDNIETLNHLTSLCDALSLAYSITPPTPSVPPKAAATAEPDVALVLNFTTAQRTWLLTSPATRALLYTPTNEHFGIIPVEGMISRLPVLACDSGGPTESIVDPGVAADAGAGAARTGWLRPPEVTAWSAAILEILRLSDAERSALGERARQRALTTFSQDAMARSIQDALEEAVSMGEMKGGLFCRGILILCMVLAIAMWQRFYVMEK